MNDDINLIKLCAIKDIGAITAARLLAAFGSAEAVLSASKDDLMKVEKIGAKTAESIIDGAKSIDASKMLDALNRIGARYISFKNPDYPRDLLPLPDRPIGLYALGKCDLSAPSIAIVGTRNCSVYGQIAARKFAAAFARAGFTVVSGMARGIDAMAHTGAIEAGGKTVAVLGSGVDVIYPPDHINLYRKIIENGAVISEFPIGARADRQNFPIRNRIVAGMTTATLVVESDIKGGSMITARVAAEYGKDVFAIPGRIDSALSKGCNALIADGAILAASPEDVINYIKFGERVRMSLKFGTKNRAPVQADIFDTPPQTTPDGVQSPPAIPPSAPQKNSAKTSKAPEPNLSADERKILEIVRREQNVHIDTIAELSGLEVRKCLPLLTMLELKRLVKKSAGGFFRPAED